MTKFKKGDLVILGDPQDPSDWEPATILEYEGDGMYMAEVDREDRPEDDFDGLREVHEDLISAPLPVYFQRNPAGRVFTTAPEDDTPLHCLSYLNNKGPGAQYDETKFDIAKPAFLLKYVENDAGGVILKQGNIREYWQFGGY